MLLHAHKRPPSRYQFTPYETVCIIKTHKLLLEDLSKKPMSLQLLSRPVAINEFKLKARFRQIFGLSIFNCLHAARMEKAWELLLSTDMPIKQTCVLTSYPRMTNFINRFTEDTFGKLFGDKGYISKALSDLLFADWSAINHQD
jgi:AraC-like DNA-binding protein